MFILGNFCCAAAGAELAGCEAPSSPCSRCCWLAWLAGCSSPAASQASATSSQPAAPRQQPLNLHSNMLSLARASLLFVFVYFLFFFLFLSASSLLSSGPNSLRLSTNLVGRFTLAQGFRWRISAEMLLLRRQLCV